MHNRSLGRPVIGLTDVLFLVLILLPDSTWAQAAPLAVITAVVAEYFGGTKLGLGSSITTNLSTSKKDLGLAYVAGASVLGLAFFGGAAVLEYVAVPWQRRRDSR